MGTAGFVLAVLALVFFWMPFVGGLMWFLGLLFSFIGLFKRPRGLAVAGFITSLVGLVVMIVVGVFAAILLVFA